MIFTSMEFLFLFFPITLGVYFILPKFMRNYWLFVASIFFYAWGEPKFVLAMLFSIVWNYLSALVVEKLRMKQAATANKIVLLVSVLGNLSVLFVFKYMNFVTGNLGKVFPSIEQTKFVLPIGISFFTFQALSYVVDVYRGIPAQKNPFYVGLYIALFPQLIAGPIVRYTTIMDQIEQREITMSSFSKGMHRFLFGFNKKVLLANLLACVADEAFAMSELSVGMAWLGAICYSLQIFYDFSGYSEMAIGLGEMFGFHFLENFNYPYISKTITEFWRRWHISLGSWFRDYVYFPLGGSRVKTKKRLLFNLSVVWLATGIWHGANWTFILWGILHGTVVIVEKIFSIPAKIEKRKSTTAIYRIITLLVVVIGWVLFRAEEIGSGFTYIQAMFGIGSTSVIDSTCKFYAREYLCILVAGLLCATPMWGGLKAKIFKDTLQVIGDNISYVVQFVLFVVSVSFLVMNAHNPFIYFNF